MDAKPDAISLLKERENKDEKLAWEMFDEMVGWAREYGRGYEDAIDEVASDLQRKHAYRVGELSGQRESFTAQLESARREK